MKGNMKFTTKNVLIGLSVGLGFALLIAIFSGDEPTTTPSYTPSPRPAYKPSPSPVSKLTVVRQTYLEGCIGDAPETRAYCVCTYDYITEDLGIPEDQFIQDGLEMLETDEFTDYMVTAIMYCMDQL